MISGLLNRKIGFALLIALFAFVMSSGCAVTLVSSYDEKTEDYVSDFRAQVDTFLTALERNAGEPVKPEAIYNHNTRFYDETRITLRGMLNRASQIDNNEITI